MTFTASFNDGTIILSILNIGHDTVILDLGDLRALESARSKWATNFIGDRTSPELFNELVVNARLDVNTRTSAARLPLVVKNTKIDLRDSVIYVSIIKNDVRGFTTEFQGDPLQV